MQTILIASNNPGKIAEIKASLTDLPIKCLSQADLNISEIVENGSTYSENALIKARHAAEISGLTVMADDSGLSIDALDGAPGIYSARYAGEGASDADRINKVLKAMEGVPDEQRSAHFQCVIALVRNATDPSPLLFKGTWPGKILSQPRGDCGFGYDPIFYVPTHHCSAAELDPTIKNKISHRAIALAKLRAELLIPIPE